ncbi:hypothetical protein Dimus_020073, partial [Dionaea muscipula]
AVNYFTVRVLPNGSQLLIGESTMAEGDEAGNFDARFAHLTDSIEVRKVRVGQSGVGIDVSELGPASVLLDIVHRLAAESGVFPGGHGCMAGCCAFGAPLDVVQSDDLICGGCVLDTACSAGDHGAQNALGKGNQTVAGHIEVGM